jgi:hypothetical protein
LKGNQNELWANRDHCVWHRTGRHHSYAALNVFIFAGALVLHFVGDACFPRHGHIDDFLAPLLLLPYAALLFQLGGYTFTTAAAFGVTFFAAILWEGVAPFLIQSTADPLDVVMYFSAAALYAFVAKVADTK